MKATRAEVRHRLGCLAAKALAGTCLMAFLQPPLPGDYNDDGDGLGGSRGHASDLEVYEYFGRGPASQSMLAGLAAADGLTAAAAAEGAVPAGSRVAGHVLRAGLEYGHTSAWVWALYLFLSISTDLGQVWRLTGKKKEARPLRCFSSPCLLIS